VSVAAYDLGIHLQDVSPHLHERGAVKIVGYERSGKSTLAEILASELRELRTTVVHQNATAWLHRRPGRSAEVSEQAASVDPELAEAISRLEEEEESCWVVDDAEVLLAYATDDLLRSIGRKIMSGRFSMILIRNRFVHEQAGWFSDRETLLDVELPTLQLEPLPELAALQAARAFYRGPSADFRASWLVTMSGGIPGLMSELAPLAPLWANVPPSSQLRTYAMRRRHELRLDRPLRSALVRALEQGALPPRPMLSSAAGAELGALEIAGMIHPRYAQRSEPFRGEFWRLVVGAVEPMTLSGDVETASIELEIIIRELGVASQLAIAVGLEEVDELELAKAFARSFCCQRVAPELVKPLSSILADELGKAQLANALQRGTGAADITSSSHDLADRLLTAVGLT
jgi:hypothetical protein